MDAQIDPRDVRLLFGQEHTVELENGCVLRVYVHRVDGRPTLRVYDRNTRKPIKRVRIRLDTAGGSMNNPE